MRRAILSIVAGCLFSLFGFLFVWAFSESLPGWFQPVVYAFAPGYGLVELLQHFVDLRASEVPEVLGLLLFYAINAAFWATIFYGLATVYVHRWEQRRTPA